MNELLHDALVEFLTKTMSAHVGIANPISTRELDGLAALRFPWEKNINRKWRMIMEDETLVINGRRERVCSVGHGYFVPANDQEAARAARFLTSYIAALAHRRKGIYEAYPDARQGELPGTGSAA